MYTSVLPVCVCVPCVCMSCARGSKRKALNPLALRLKVMMNQHVDAGNHKVTCS